MHKFKLPSCLKEAIELDETAEQVNVESNTKIEEKNDCELDEIRIKLIAYMNLQQSLLLLQSLHSV